MGSTSCRIARGGKDVGHGPSGGRACLSEDDDERSLKGSTTHLCWTRLISEHAKLGKGRKALRAYKEMREEGFIPNSYAFVAALKGCISMAQLEAGKRIHKHAIESSHQIHICVANTLIDMYSKCGSIEDARLLFETMPRRDLVTWNTMMMGYANMEMGEVALALYRRMQHEGFATDNRTFVATVKACSSLAAQEQGKAFDGKLLKVRSLEKGRAIHANAAKSGFESDIYVASALVDMYAKCGSIMEARQVFEKMPCHNVVSWNALMTGYAQMEMAELALELYARMRHEGFAPDNFTFVSVLKACGSLAIQEGKTVDSELRKRTVLEQGRAIHSEVAKSGLESDIFVASTLVDMYAKCGSIEDACQVFEKMMYRNVVSWNAMILGYAQVRMGELALNLYLRMQLEGVTPDDRTFVAVLKACSSMTAIEEGKVVNDKLLKLKCLKQGRAIHAEIVTRGFDSDIYVANALVDMYAKCGSMVDAQQVFQKMMHRDVVSWNTIIMGYVQMEMGELALEIYAYMQQKGFTADDRTFVAVLKACSCLAEQEEGRILDGGSLKIRCLEWGRAIHAEIKKAGFDSDVFVASTLVDMYAKCGSIVDARRLFEKMSRRNVVSWNVIIMCYTKAEMGKLALELFLRMQNEGFTPNYCTFIAVLKACGSLASLEAGKEIHAHVQKVRLEDDLSVANCLIDMYGKCGSMMDAQQFFDALLVRDTVTWNALIAGYSGKGDLEHVFSLYKRMQQEGVEPDGVTFISILTVCSYNGLVDNGQIYFQAMLLEYGISPSNKHYICMVDLLGRAGQLDEAVTMVKKMQFKPDLVTWISILGACRKWSQVETARSAFECAVTFDEKCTAAYVLMSNIYATAHMLEECANIQEKGMKAQAWRNSGWCRWTDSSGIVHTFLVEDGDYSQSKEMLITESWYTDNDELYN